jgi:phosphoglycolate phosphatase
VKLIFDLDGTLTDPREGIARSFAHALERMGAPVPPQSVLESCIGPPAQVGFKTLLGTEDMDRVWQAIGLYRERYGTLGMFENVPYPGIHDARSRLKEAGYKLWVCTGKPRVYAEQIIRHFKFEEHFQGIYGPELDGTRADKSELLSYLLRREGVSAAEALMIGDRKHDAHAARANAMRCLGVLYGFGHEQELREAKFDELISSVSELESAVGRLMR